jgi:thioester reductase-like protein
MVDPSAPNPGMQSMFGRGGHGHHADMDDSPLFLTGATGFVGMELLARYLERTDRTVFALVRGSDDADAQARLDATVARMLPDPDTYSGRAIAVRGDVTSPGLGMSAERHGQLAAEVGEIVHAAASVSFALPLPESRTINVRGTQHVLEFAHSVESLRRLSYISTAYVAGDHGDSFSEDQLDIGQCFRNPYEQSKFEAETLVREHCTRLPIQIFRPSIVVGEADTGWTPAFNVIYWPLKAFTRGTYTAVPARRSAPVDVVPVSYVADAVFELTRKEAASGTTYNLAAGERASTVGELLELGADYFDRRRPRVVPPRAYRALVHPLLLRKSGERRRKALESSEAFFPYFAMRVRYDTANARAGLESTGVSVPALPEYFDRLMGYAVTADWGRDQRDRRSLGVGNALPPSVPPFEPARTRRLFDLPVLPE